MSNTGYELNMKSATEIDDVHCPMCGEGMFCQNCGDVKLIQTASVPVWSPSPMTLEMSALPAALVQNPACGACGDETICYGGDDLQCESCELCFDPNDNFAASFLDPEAKPCGLPCDNYWHNKPGQGFGCSPCGLPTGHTSPHWTGCEPLHC